MATRSRPRSCRENDDEIVMRAVEDKTGLARDAPPAPDAVRGERVPATAAGPRATREHWPARRRSRSRSGTTGPRHSLSASCEARVLELAGRGVDVNRFKGLGEMNPGPIARYDHGPRGRTLVRVTVEDAAAADMVFSMLMGDQVEPRRPVHRGQRPPRDQPRRLGRDGDDRHV